MVCVCACMYVCVCANSTSLPSNHRFDIYSLDKSSKQDEAGIISAASRGMHMDSTIEPL